MELKVLSNNDYERIRNFDLENFKLDHWKSEDWIMLLNDPECIYYAFIENNEIIANVFIYINPDGYIKIMNLGVRKSHRGRGLASKLLDIITMEYSTKGFKKFYGETRFTNYSMQKSFEKSAYKVRCISKDVYENPKEDAIKYQLILE